jgi:hypothetical protein
MCLSVSRIVSRIRNVKFPMRHEGGEMDTLTLACLGATTMRRNTSLCRSRSVGRSISHPCIVDFYRGVDIDASLDARLCRGVDLDSRLYRGVDAIICRECQETRG